MMLSIEYFNMKKKKLELTARQAQVFKFIKRFQAKHGYPPTRAEIAKQFQFKSPNAVTDHLKAIERSGWIKIVPLVSRGIKIV